MRVCVPAFEGDCECGCEYFLSLLPGVVTPAHPLRMLQVNSSLKTLELRYNFDIDVTAGQRLADAIMVRDA